MKEDKFPVAKEDLRRDEHDLRGHHPGLVEREEAEGRPACFVSKGGAQGHAEACKFTEEF